MGLKVTMTCNKNIYTLVYCHKIWENFSCPSPLEFNPCSRAPCQNGGICTNIAESCASYACECVGCFTGYNCQTRKYIMYDISKQSYKYVPDVCPYIFCLVNLHLTTKCMYVSKFGKSSLLFTK